MSIDLIADPLNENDVLLVFQDVGAIRRDVEGDADIEVDNYSQELRVEQLEDELDETRSKLRTTVEELETSNEELKSSNEEMMSMNEELQSTNEELATVNEELKNKVDQLGRTNSDLQNFIESTQVPTIFLDRRMRIRSFTPATRSLFRFQDQDRGRLFSDVVSRVDQRQLELWGLKVLETGDSIEEELSLEDGKECYVLRVLPYRDVERRDRRRHPGVFGRDQDPANPGGSRPQRGTRAPAHPRNRNALQDRSRRDGGGRPQPSLSQDQSALRRSHRQFDGQSHRTNASPMRRRS